MKHLFIVNPIAGGKNNRHNEIERDIKLLMSELKENFEVYVTKAPLDAISKIKAEAENCEDLRVYACGGDGTLNECVNGAATLQNVSVTHFPCGTGNDFIKMFGDEKTRFMDIRQLVQGEVRPIDVIDCNGRYSVNICSVGIDSRIGADVHKYSYLPVIGGAFAYIVSTVVNFFKGINSKFTIRTENEEFTGEFALACACNGRYYGGGFNPIKDARPDDGILDFLIVKKVSRLKFLAFVGSYAKGEYYKASEFVTRVNGEKLDIYADEEFIINVDGEVINSRFAHFKIVPGGVNFIFPKNMKFFNNEAEKIEANA